MPPRAALPAAPPSKRYQDGELYLSPWLRDDPPPPLPAPSPQTGPPMRRERPVTVFPGLEWFNEQTRASLSPDDRGSLASQGSVPADDVSVRDGSSSVYSSTHDFDNALAAYPLKTTGLDPAGANAEMAGGLTPTFSPSSAPSVDESSPPPENAFGPEWWMPANELKFARPAHAGTEGDPASSVGEFDSENDRSAHRENTGPGAALGPTAAFTASTSASSSQYSLAASSSALERVRRTDPFEFDNEPFISQLNAGLFSTRTANSSRSNLRYFTVPPADPHVPLPCSRDSEAFQRYFSKPPSQADSIADDDPPSLRD